MANEKKIKDNSKSSGFSDAFKTLMKYKAAKFALLGIVALLCVSIFFAAIGSRTNHDSRSIKLRFEDIGELATQAAYVTSVHVTDSARDLFGIQIPFTESKLIYSYDITIKAGLDFTQIDYNIDEKTKTISVVMPAVKILSNTPDPDSFKVYHEKESLFKNIGLNDSNDALKEMMVKAEQDAINNGLLEEASENAKLLIKNFFAIEYDLNEYTYEISVKE